MVDTLTLAKVALRIYSPFFSSLLIHLKFKEMRGDEAKMCPTGGTNGEYLYYNREWIDKRSVSEVAVFLLHEAGHIIFEHIPRRQYRDQLRFNIAGDYVVNEMIAKEIAYLREKSNKFSDVLAMPPDVLYDPEFAGMFTEQVYEKLPPTKKITVRVFSGDSTSPFNSDGSVKTPGESGATMDSHSFWDDGSKGEEGEDSNSSGDSSASTGYDEALWKDRIIQAKAIAKMQGRLSAHIEELVDKLIRPKVNWKRVIHANLVSHIVSDYRRHPPNRRHVWRGVYLPSSKGESLDAVYVLDTSGSMSYEDCVSGISEVVGIMRQFGNFVLHFLQVDAGVAEYTILTNGKSVLPKKFKGRGGTDFRPAFDFVAEKRIRPDVLIYFTDLMGTFPERAPRYPVIWLTTWDTNTKDSSSPPFGKVIHYQRTEKSDG